MQKYGDNQPAAVYRGREASVLNDYIKKYGKPLSDFSEDEKAIFTAELESVREPVEEAPVKTTPKRTTKKADVESTE